MIATNEWKMIFKTIVKKWIHSEHTIAYENDNTKWMTALQRHMKVYL